MARDPQGIDLDTQITSQGAREVPEVNPLDDDGLPNSPDSVARFVWPEDWVTQIGTDGKRRPIEDHPYFEEV